MIVLSHLSFLIDLFDLHYLMHSLLSFANAVFSTGSSLEYDKQKFAK